MGGVAASSQRTRSAAADGPAGRATPLPSTVHEHGATTVAVMAAFRSGWSKAAKTRCALSSPACTAR